MYNRLRRNKFPRPDSFNGYEFTSEHKREAPSSLRARRRSRPRSEQFAQLVEDMQYSLIFYTGESEAVLRLIERVRRAETRELTNEQLERRSLFLGREGHSFFEGTAALTDRSFRRFGHRRRV
jgi:hypothetical protein